jgi:hypothetical protein
LAWPGFGTRPGDVKMTAYSKFSGADRQSKLPLANQLGAAWRRMRFC